MTSLCWEDKICQYAALTINLHPMPSALQVTHIKSTITRPNIIVGEYSYFDDVNFKEYVTHLGSKRDTHVGNGVWIGQNVTILPRKHIGNGAIIGASSLVSGKIALYSVVGGNPARTIRKRFDEELTALMEDSQW